MPLLWIIILVLVILWLAGWLGPTYYSGLPRTGGLIHLLIVLALVLLLLQLLGAI